VQACHEFHACYDGPCPTPRRAESSGGAASSAGEGTDASAGASGSSAAAGGTGAAAGGELNLAGDAGAGGGAGALTCPPPSANCDESSLTGCEVNLLTNVANCGACGARCRGVCALGECHAFETLASDFDPPPYRGIDFTSSDVYALSSRFSTQLLRWSEGHGAESLLSDGPDFSGIVSGVDRVYLLGSYDDRLWSIPFSGGMLSEDQQTAIAAVRVGPTLYAVDTARMPYSRAQGSQSRDDLPLPSGLASTLPEDAEAIMASDGVQVVLAMSRLDDKGAALYWVFLLQLPRAGDSSQWQLLGTGPGELRGVRVSGSAAYLDLVVNPTDGVNDSDVMHELRELSFDNRSMLLQRVAGVLDFTIVNARLYASLELHDNASALRIVPLEDPSLSVDYETSAPMASLSLSLPYFYFGDGVRHDLSRLRAWLE